MDLVINDIEVRIIGCLMEKSYTTPENYPLSLNSLRNACNQKSNRNPVVNFDEQMLMQALDHLCAKQLVVRSTAARVTKYAENFVAGRHLLDKEAAVLTLLFLRGPQTLGELRGRSERMYQFDDTGEVEEVVGGLVDSGFVAMLPKQPGHKEHRFAHLLSGEPVVAEDMVASAVTPISAETQKQDDRVARLEEEVAALRQQLAELHEQFLRFKSEFS